MLNEQQRRDDTQDTQQRPLPTLEKRHIYPFVTASGLSRSIIRRSSREGGASEDG
jgi:hypothetical protein